MPKITKATTPVAIPLCLEVRDILTELGWTNVTAAAKLGVHTNSIARYKGGGIVPGPVMAYLRLRRQIGRLAR